LCPEEDGKVAEYAVRMEELMQRMCPQNTPEERRSAERMGINFCFEISRINIDWIIKKSKLLILDISKTRS